MSGGTSGDVAHLLLLRGEREYGETSLSLWKGTLLEWTVYCRGSRTAVTLWHLLFSGEVSRLFDPYPKKAVGVLREDRMPPLVGVRVRDGLDPRPQQLVPQQGSVSHGIWKQHHSFDQQVRLRQVRGR